MNNENGHTVTIREREKREHTESHATALACLTAGIAAARPDQLIPAAVTIRTDQRGATLDVQGQNGATASYALDDYDRVLLLGAGKAAASAADAVVEEFATAGLTDIEAGVVVTDDPEAKPDPPGVDVRPGDHPLPSDRGADSARAVLDIAESATADDLVLTLITGGGSALLAAPASPISTADLRELTEALLASGASIDEINAVRKHCSAVKGGQLARAVAPATVLTLAISDVIGDPLETIASGPTVPDPTTYADALATLDRYRIDAPTLVRERLEAGSSGAIEETPVEGDEAFDRADAFVVGNGRTALDAAATVAAERGYDPLVLAAGVRGDSRESATTHAAIAEECADSTMPVAPPAVLLSGGETTVTLGEDPGTGGPNAEFAASAGLALATGPLATDEHTADATRIVVASVDTDGIDGPTDAAGAIVDPTTLDPETARNALDHHDVYPVLDDADALIRTGPTGTNVNDLRVFVIEAADDE